MGLYTSGQIKRATCTVASSIVAFRRVYDFILNYIYSCKLQTKLNDCSLVVYRYTYWIICSKLRHISSQKRNKTMLKSVEMRLFVSTSIFRHGNLKFQQNLSHSRIETLMFHPWKLILCVYICMLLNESSQ